MAEALVRDKGYNLRSRVNTRSGRGGRLACKTSGEDHCDVVIERFQDKGEGRYLFKVNITVIGWRLPVIYIFAY
jgi:hypothetical protein